MKVFVDGTIAGQPEELARYKQLLNVGEPVQTRRDGAASADGPLLKPESGRGR